MFKSTVTGFGNRKFIQEDKNPKTKKVYVTSTYELIDNDEMISVKFKKYKSSFKNI